MTITELNTYTAIVNIGFKKGYTGKMIGKKKYLEFISSWHLKNKKHSKFLLCPAVYKFDFVNGEYKEPHLAIKFVNYPKSPLENVEFRKQIIDFAKEIMLWSSQNRILIEFSDRTFLLEDQEHLTGLNH